MRSFRGGKLQVPKENATRWLRIPTKRDTLTFVPHLHENFARRLRELREERRLSQSQLAGRMQELGIPIDRVAITKIEQAAIESGSTRKPRKVTVEEAVGFAAALDVSLDALIPEPGATPHTLEPLTREHFDERVDELTKDQQRLQLAVHKLEVLYAAILEGLAESESTSKRRAKA